ncbi:MAG: efflux RND transporter permease subunit [Rikenellaceae bacterium]
MSIPKLAIRNRNITWFLLLLFIVGGAFGFVNLGKKEDSTFVIKSASLICRYPGATPAEVEMLITEPIEREVQTMRNRYKITSDSQYGLSKILVELDPATPPDEIPQLWDELRRKVSDVQPRLPVGASEVIVSDDFGDVYGIYFALSASWGFSFTELRDWAQRIKTKVVTIGGVEKVTLYGEQTPVVNLYISLSQLSNFSIRPEQIISTISRQNSVVSSGEKQAGEMRIRVVEQGSYTSLEDIAKQLLIAADGKQYRLGDIARVEREYLTPPTSLMRVNGRRAIGIGVSTSGDVDVVATGREIGKMLKTMELEMPVGINLEILYPEDEIAREATDSFLINLALSVAIVVFVIMLLMGFRSGLLIGSSLLFTIGSTLLIMLFVGEGLNRTSLAGFIIAMGMLVDNAIVVVDGATNSIRRGVRREEAVVRAADRPKWSLLGATVIAIFSFLPLYLAPSAVAEIVKPLFVVLAISLIMSWVLALTQTPLFGLFMLKGGECEVEDGEEISDGGKSLYDNWFYRWFDRFLVRILRRRWLVVLSSILLLLGSIKVMERMPQDFFPSLDKPYFRADLILPDGYNIDATQAVLIELEEWLQRQDEVKSFSATAGGTPPRYYLASSAVMLTPNFANLLVELHDKSQSEAVERRFNRYVREFYPDVWVRSSLFKLSPVPDASIEMGFIGENIDTLIALTERAEAIMWRNPRAVNVRNSWGNRSPSIQPIYSQMKGGRIGVSRSDLAQGMMVATTGYQLGDYREGDQIMPILMRDSEVDRVGGANLSNIETMPIFSPKGRIFSVEQATSGFRFEYDLNVIKRYNRQRVMKAQCDPDREVNTKQLYTEIVDSVKRYVSIPNGYSFKVFGEEETQVESNDALAENFPLTIVLIFVTLLLLFGGYREPLMIMIVTPLVFIGVVAGLYISGRLFNFFALLGLLGLVGMNVKNGVVLIAQIGELQGAGVARGRALREATRSRLLPVMMASGTTILGMIPLLFDSLFAAMAATIMGGLVVATLLTFCLLPTLYAIFYRIKNSELCEEI